MHHYAHGILSLGGVLVFTGTLEQKDHKAVLLSLVQARGVFGVDETQGLNGGAVIGKIVLLHGSGDGGGGNQRIHQRRIIAVEDIGAPGIAVVRGCGNGTGGNRPSNRNTPFAGSGRILGRKLHGVDGTTCK